MDAVDCCEHPDPFDPASKHNSQHKTKDGAQPYPSRAKHQPAIEHLNLLTCEKTVLNLVDFWAFVNPLN